MTRIRFDSEAEAELRAAISRYDRERDGLGDEFWNEVPQALRLIEEHDEIGATAPGPLQPLSWATMTSEGSLRAAR